MKQANYVEALRERYPDRVLSLRAGGPVPITLAHLRQPACESVGVAANALTISMLRSGTMGAEFDLGSGAFGESCRPGHFVIPVPGSPTRLRLDGAHEVLGFTVPLERVQPLVEEATGMGADAFAALHRRGHYDAAIQSLLEELWAELAEGGPRGALFADHALNVLVLRLLRIAEHATVTPSRGGLAPWQVRRVVECLDAHLADDVPLRALAELVELSPNHFCTAFRISLGEPPHRYLIRRRIERAKEMLADPRLSITEVALAVGFGSSAHFATAFRKQVGVTPTDFRRERLQ